MRLLRPLGLRRGCICMLLLLAAGSAAAEAFGGPEGRGGFGMMEANRTGGGFGMGGPGMGGGFGMGGPPGMGMGGPGMGGPGMGMGGFGGGIEMGPLTPPPAFPENLPAEEMVLGLMGREIFSQVNPAELMQMCPDADRIADKVMGLLSGLNRSSICDPLRSHRDQCVQAKSFCEQMKSMEGPQFGGPPGEAGGVKMSCPPDETQMKTQCQERMARQMSEAQKQTEEEAPIRCELMWEQQGSMMAEACARMSGSTGPTGGPMEPSRGGPPSGSFGAPTSGGTCPDLTSEFRACQARNGNPSIEGPGPGGCKYVKCEGGAQASPGGQVPTACPDVTPDIKACETRGGKPYAVEGPGCKYVKCEPAGEPYGSPPGGAPVCRDVTPDYQTCERNGGKPAILYDNRGCKYIKCEPPGATPGPTATPPPTYIPTPTATPAPATPVPTPTPTPTSTPTPTPTSSPRVSSGSLEPRLLPFALALQAAASGGSGGGGYGEGPPGGYGGGGGPPPGGDYGRGGGPPGGYGGGGGPPPGGDYGRGGGPPGGYGGGGGPPGGMGGGMGGPPGGMMGGAPACDKATFISQCVTQSKAMVSKMATSQNSERICALEFKLNQKHIQRFCDMREKGYQTCVNQSQRACGVLDTGLQRCEAATTEAGIRDLVRKKAAQECSRARITNTTSGGAPTRRAGALARALDALDTSEKDLGTNYRPWVAAEKSRILEAAGGIQEVEKSEQSKDTGYAISKFFGMQAKREKEEATKSKEQATRLTETVKSLKSLLEQLDSGTAKDALQAQVTQLETQAQELLKGAQEKEKGADGFLSSLRGLFGG